MKPILQRLGVLLGRTVDGLFGLIGGLVWAFATCLVTLQLNTALKLNPLVPLTVCILLATGFCLGGLFRPRYFGLFSAPLFSAVAGDGAQFTTDDVKWTGCATVLGLFLALLALLLGTLFRSALATLIGTLLFVAYAVVAPRVRAAEGPRHEAPSDRCPNGESPHSSADSPPTLSSGNHE